MEVSRWLDDERLSREHWVFSIHGGALVLTKYFRKQTRKTRRHGFKGDFWSSLEERRYHSKLERPTDIPDWVIEEAISQIKISVHIGWSSRQHLLKTVSVEAKTKK